MKLNDFAVEQWMNDHEQLAVYNLTDTCIKALRFDEFQQKTGFDLSDIVLDYGQITGDIELRSEISKLYRTGTSDNITVANGCLEANVLVMETLLGPGDHIIACKPGYQQFPDYPRSLGCEVTEVDLSAKNEWKASVSDFEAAINDRTKMILLNNPNNPTGTLFDEVFLKELIDICRHHKIWLFCDEVYRDPRFVPSVSDLYEKGVSTGSLSKLFGLAGLRLGWVRGPESLIRQINSRRDYVMISTGALRDTMAAAALKHKEKLLEDAKAILDANKSVLNEWLAKHPGFSCHIPEQGTVCFLQIKGMKDSVSTAEMLLKEHGIFFVPGACFGIEGYMRLGLGQDPSMFEQGLERLAQALKAGEKVDTL